MSSRPLLRNMFAVTALLIFAAACSDTETEAALITSEEETVSTTVGSTNPTKVEATESTVAAEVEPTEAETPIAKLWGQTLDFFGAAPQDRSRLVVELEGRVPVDEVMRIAEDYFVLGEAIDVTSNARFSEQPGGQIEIIDCADTSGPSVLGSNTAGFRASAELSAAGQVVIKSLETVVSCVQQEHGHAALDRYVRYLEASDQFWSDPRPDHPAITAHRTEQAAIAYRDYVSQLEESDLLATMVVNNEPLDRWIEIVSYRPGEITLRDCQYGDETFGMFDSAGNRADELEPPWRFEVIIRMVEVDGQWLYDELVNRLEGDCELGPSRWELKLL